MTKKHFEAIAAVLRVLNNRAEYRPDSHPEIAMDVVVREFADMCARSNPRFDRNRFIAACNGGAR